MIACTECGGKVHSRGLCNKHYRRQLTLAKMRDCACGCGGQTAYTYVWGHHTRLFTSEEQSRRGRQNDGTAQRDRGAGLGYRKVGGRHEHRAIAEVKIGRPLARGEIVHHKDGDKRNNDPGNLEVMTQAEHARLHILVRNPRHG